MNIRKAIHYVKSGKTDASTNKKNQVKACAKVSLAI